MNNKYLKRCLTPLDIRDKVKPHLNTTTWPTRRAKMRNMGHNLVLAKTRSKSVKPRGKTRRQSVLQLNIRTLSRAVISLPAVYPKETCAQVYQTSSTQQPTSQTAEPWKPSKCPSAAEWINRATWNSRSSLAGTFPGAAGLFVWTCMLSGRCIHFGKIHQAAPTCHVCFSICVLSFR